MSSDAIHVKKIMSWNQPPFAFFAYNGRKNQTTVVTVCFGGKKHRFTIPPRLDSQLHVSVISVPELI